MTKPCDWCDDETAAVVRVTYTDLEGTVLDMAYLCEQCCKRGATWNGKAIDAHD